MIIYFIESGYLTPITFVHQKAAVAYVESIGYGFVPNDIDPSVLVYREEMTGNKIRIIPIKLYGA